MKVIIRYHTLSSNNLLYFVDFRCSDGLQPIGCRPYRRENATVFHSMAEAGKVFDILEASGRKPAFCKPGTFSPYP